MLADGLGRKAQEMDIEGEDIPESIRACITRYIYLNLVDSSTRTPAWSKASRFWQRKYPGPISKPTPNSMCSVHIWH